MLVNFRLSPHLLERASERGITEDIIIAILENPEQIVDDENGQSGQKVYQSIVQLSGKSAYLVRVFVDIDKQPNVAKSVYKTSKISKYYES